MPDHAALLFEYMAHLSLGGDEPACKEFMVKHLDWLDDLAREIQDTGIGGVYVHGALIAGNIAKRHAIDLAGSR